MFPDVSHCIGKGEGYCLVQSAVKHTLGDSSRFAGREGEGGSACLPFSGVGNVVGEFGGNHAITALQNKVFFFF